MKRTVQRCWPSLLRQVCAFWVIFVLVSTGDTQSLSNPDAGNWNSLTWSHQAWSTENGLPQNSVHQILQTRDGYIWIATEGGVARFDGINFKVFNQESDVAFTSDDVCCLAQDAHGSLWIGTGDGLLEYSESAFHRFSTADGLPGAVITSLAAADDGSLLVLTSSGLARFDGKRFSPLPLLPSAMNRAGDGRVLLASASGVFQYEQGHIRALPIDPGMRKEGINGIGRPAGHSLWVFTPSGITFLKNGRPQTWQAGRDFPGARVESCLQDLSGIFWIGTNKGLITLDKSGDHPQLQSAIGANTVRSIFEDREGNIWIGTDTDGLHILRPQKFRTLSQFSGRAITAITQATDAAMWVGSNGDGLDRWQSGTVRHFSTNNGLISNIILALAAGANGSVWVGTPDGLNHVDNGSVTTYTSADGLPDDFIRSLLLDADGSLWIGTRRGLAHWQNDHFTVLTTADGLDSDLIGALLKSRAHALWIGTLGGLARLQNGSLSTYTTKNGLSGDIVTSLLEDSHGTLWIGTDGHGLSRSTASGFESQTGRGLPKSINSILEDARGYLWLSSNRGITRVSAAELGACRSSAACDPDLNFYGVSDGMPTEQTSAIGHPTAWRTASDLLWFGTRKGVAIADPGHLPENRIAPSVVIERFTVDDSERALSPGEQIISPGHSRFAFEYAGLSYIAPARVSYRYILKSFDKQWTSAGSRRVAYYTNLPPGHYRFRVQAANNDGVWNQTGAGIAFYVRPPFYRRLWFLLLLLFSGGALLAAVIMLLYRLRVRRLQSQFDAVLAERNRIAREIHDTLAQGFAGVSMQLELAAQLLAQSQVPAAHAQIDRTRAFVRESLADARRGIWDLRATTAQETLPTRLRNMVERSASPSLARHVNIGGVYRPLAPEFEDQVLRIGQEALANVTRHAAATTVAVELLYDAYRLVLTIADDGRGFQAAEDALLAEGHFGLKGMRERAAQIDAQLEVESSPGLGTKIKLDAPITREKG